MAAVALGNQARTELSRWGCTSAPARVLRVGLLTSGEIRFRKRTLWLTFFVTFLAILSPERLASKVQPR